MDGRPGPGGRCKSTLVARFAELTADRYGLVWWITVDTPGAVRAGLADLAIAVRPESGALTPEQRVESAIRWLSTRQDWLLVLDNVPGRAAVDDLLARVHTGTIVITSRQATGWRGLTTLSLDVLAPVDAEELLTRTLRADWPDADTSAAARLCEELGWLPLAVEQAGAYLGQARVPPAAYLDLFGRHPAAMFAATGEGEDSRRTVARIWRITLDRVADTDHRAGRAVPVDRRGGEGRRGVVGDVEEVGRLQVSVASVVATGDGCHIDDHGDLAVRRVLRHLDGALDTGEPAAHLRQQEMPAHEADFRMPRIEPPDARCR